jgi:tetratricopeptide (TPR) repeat protein
MAILEQKIQERIDELIDLAYTKFEEGKIEESFSIQKEAWDLYPEPKNQWYEAYNTAKYIYLDYLNIKSFDEAKIWLNRMIDINNNLHSRDEVWFETAKYQYEIGDYKESYDKLKLVVEDAGFRYFEGEDPKYLDFYKNPEKYIK